MSDPLPDNEAFYTSPLDTETLAAVGRLITCWAAVESAMAFQVARIVSVSFDNKQKAYALDVPGFLKGALVCQGTAIKASITQIQNLLKSRAAEIKPHADGIFKIKAHRDAFAHNTSGRNNVTNGDVSLQSYGASRSKMGKRVTYSASQINDWCDELKQHARSIDAIISDTIWFTWTRIEEAQNIWIESQNLQN